MESAPIQISHFSHRHPLEPLLDDVEEKEGIICSACELQLISGAGFRCTKPTCDFTLHESCLGLPRQLKHDSHPSHRLVLHFHAPYPGGEFTCSACADVGHGFTYHCAACKFDLHVECASLPEVEHREDHDHPFVLLYPASFPAPAKGDAKGKGKAEDLIYCFVCRGTVDTGRWLYRCSGCRYGAHLDCISK